MYSAKIPGPNPRESRVSYSFRHSQRVSDMNGTLNVLLS
jgi:hypothetical protein